MPIISAVSTGIIISELRNSLRELNWILKSFIRTSTKARELNIGLTIYRRTSSILTKLSISSEGDFMQLVPNREANT